MSYQPLYGTVTDQNDTRTSSSQRGRVDWIDFNLNSVFGNVVDISTRTSGSLTDGGNRTYECEQKIKHWEEKGNDKKVLEWHLKLAQASKEYDEGEKKEYVSVNVNRGKEDPRFIFEFEGVVINDQNLKIMAMLNNKDFKGVLKVLSTMIPHGKNVMEYIVAESI